MEQKRKTVVIVSDTRINGVFVNCGVSSFPYRSLQSRCPGLAERVAAAPTLCWQHRNPSDLLGLRKIQIKITYRNNELEEVMMTHVTNKANVISMVIQRSSLLSFGFY